LTSPKHDAVMPGLRTFEDRAPVEERNGRCNPHIHTSSYGASVAQDEGRVKRFGEAKDFERGVSLSESCAVVGHGVEKRPSVAQPCARFDLCHWER
jgi:hypothetical protein